MDNPRTIRALIGLCGAIGSNGKTEQAIAYLGYGPAAEAHQKLTEELNHG